MNNALQSISEEAQHYANLSQEASEKYLMSYSKAYQIYVKIKTETPQNIIKCGRKHKGYIYGREFERIIQDDKKKHSEF